MREQKIAKISEMATRMRQQVITLGHGVGNLGAHFGSGLSIIDITATLYGEIMRLDPKNPLWEDRDHFILSKGHGSLGFYTALGEAGFLTKEELDTFEKNDGFLPGQPQMNMEKGIEVSSGSLGHGLAIGIGIALVAKSSKKDFKTYVLMGDGECNEGSVWEAAMAAAHYKLDNLIVVIDRNDLQSDGCTSDIMCMDNWSEKWKSFGWETIETDGHDIGELYDAFSRKRTSGKPYVVVAKTIKGKGVSFMENNNDWHHNHLTQIQFDQAMEEICASSGKESVK
jgi:transketolase